MASVGEGNARALSVGRHRNGGDDLFRVDHDELIVRLRELHECHVRPCLLGTRADRSTDHARVRRRCYRMDGGMSAGPNPRHRLPAKRKGPEAAAPRPYRPEEYIRPSGLWFRYW